MAQDKKDSVDIKVKNNTGTVVKEHQGDLTMTRPAR